ncbi:hypothetical protein HI914_00102 [Erysiphe necator]|nr:hypothetical protein HI914_00102 [Erysiphe necator]
MQRLCCVIHIPERIWPSQLTSKMRGTSLLLAPKIHIQKLAKNTEREHLFVEPFNRSVEKLIFVLDFRA